MRLLPTPRETTQPAVSSNATTVADADIRERVAAVLRRANAPHPEPIADYVSELKSMGDAVFPVMTDELVRKIKRRREWRDGTLLACLIIQSIQFLAVVFGPDRRLIPLDVAFGLMIFLSIQFLSLTVYPFFPERMLRIVMQMDDVRAIPLLVRIDAWYEHLLSPFPIIERVLLGDEVQTCLVRLLPRLAKEDSRLLGEDTLDVLRKFLVTATKHPFIVGKIEPEYIFVVIKAVVQVRDMQSLPTLRLLAEKSRNPDIRRIAKLGVVELERCIFP